MKYNIIEFFVGAGGSHLGFVENGFESIYVNDFDENALKTLVYNNKKDLKNTIIDNSDITKINPKELKKKINKEIDVSFGGIVCKGFSLAGERSPNDSRNFFYEYYLDIVKEIKPKISVIENVKGLINAKILGKNTPQELLTETDKLWQELENFKGQKAEFRKKNTLTKNFEDYGKKLREQKSNLLKKLEPYMISVLDDILRIYKELGYKTDFKVLNSAWYGASTKRERLIIVAIRNDLTGNFKFPLPEFFDENIGTKLDFDEKDLLKIVFKKPLSVGVALSKINYSDKSDEDNKPMSHSLKTIERFKYIKAGKNIQESFNELPEELKISKFYSRGNTMRLDFNSLAPTLVPGHSNFPVHPSEHRSISVREAATITGFPLNYKFFGSHTKRCEQVGNAVPPPLSKAIAKSIREFLEKYSN
ncbi:DNA cytosine methyltransferase [Campylobacter hyointestinalis]|uniref:DNA (cytosine-5-)-methyltransferase n=1 Tax=Campylobacter hyointestinalis subsp. hyointestinalis TaxID=91352 RepID=A0A9W5ETT2_CAMHY|nr:DNA cytosine methyltransferase [Campylobacter hyointestinalis]TWO18757.1 DNA cytosine methyltransferase [Campylobacter hyointestinalis]CUU77556.1 modification methylase HaeIII (cytosine-specificmethyltransferase HaeIII%3B M.HaeIII) [Campylobacter hyointestinalis subsp. hyointestinalis]CUU89906.1 modification methylase HaeIII (cytosine-specificmethyltransferase HaeIII%3B M.HaeIII) [Campylobacter hyointestinalis subsp. hyointestinalis]